MKILIAAASALLWLTAPLAAAPLALSSHIETGWTSNAEGSAGGSGDHFVTTLHVIEVSGGDQTIALRGSIAVEATRYMRLWRENDWQASVALEAETALDAHSVLRGRFALAYGEEGAQLETIAGPLGALSPELSGSATLRYETRVGATAFGLFGGIEMVRPGQTHLEGDLLPPQTLSAHTDTLFAGLDLAHPVSPHGAVLAGAEWRGVLVTPDDQALYGRLPVHLFRLSGGAELGGAGAGLVLRGGIDMLEPGGAGIETIFLPHALAEANLAFSPHLGLRASFSAGADISDPADLYADYRLAARLGLVMTPVAGLEIDLGPFASQRRSAALGIVIEDEWGAGAGLRWSWGGLALSGRASHRFVSGLAPSYTETRLGVSLSASL